MSIASASRHPAFAKKLLHDPFVLSLYFRSTCACRAGKARFDEFRQRLGIAPNLPTRRLASLVDAGMLERRPYSVRPPRYDDRLTPRGRDFRTVLLALLDFGHRHFATEGGGARIADSRTNTTVEPMRVDNRTGEPLVEPHYQIVLGKARAAANTSRSENVVGLLAVGKPFHRSTEAGRP